MLTFDHIALTSENIARDIDYYRIHFSNTIILYQDTTWAFLKIGGQKIALVTPGQHPAHLAFRVESREELIELAQNSSVEIKMHRDSSESFYVYDPNGNALEVIYYPKK